MKSLEFAFEINWLLGIKSFYRFGKKMLGFWLLSPPYLFMVNFECSFYFFRGSCLKLVHLVCTFCLQGAFRWATNATRLSILCKYVGITNHALLFSSRIKPSQAKLIHTTRIHRYIYVPRRRCVNMFDWLYCQHVPTCVCICKYTQDAT